MTREIEVKLFGAFRRYGNGRRLRVTVDDAATVADLRAALARLLDDRGILPLLNASAFGTDDAILHGRDALPTDGRVCVLPPVSGG